MATKRFVAKNGLDNNSLTIINVADPVNAQDVATRAYVLANAGSGGGTSSFQRVVTEVTPTVGQTVFTVAYAVGYIDVFLNGVKLVVGSDFTASNGTSVTLVNASLVGDNVEFISYYSAATTRAVTSDTTTGTITPTSATSDIYIATGLTGTVAFAIPSGSPTDGQKLTIRIKDNGTARGLSWTTTAGGYRIIGTTLPLTTVASKTIYVGCTYNSIDSFWDVVSVASQV